MTSTIIAQGAEATITKSGKNVVKTRHPKKYRHPELDTKLRTERTRHEARLLEKARRLIPVPTVMKSDEKSGVLELEYVAGKKLADHLEKLNHEAVAKKIGHAIATLHDADIIHGDLTTSNMIFKESRGSTQRTISKKDQLYIIDFGLGFHSHRAEDKAVDLHVLSEALEAKHPTVFKETFQAIIKEYKKRSKNAPIVLKRLERVEKRGRYKGQY